MVSSGKKRLDLGQSRGIHLLQRNILRIIRCHFAQGSGEFLLLENHGFEVGVARLAPVSGLRFDILEIQFFTETVHAAKQRLLAAKLNGRQMVREKFDEPSGLGALTPGVGGLHRILSVVPETRRTRDS